MIVSKAHSIKQGAVIGREWCMMGWPAAVVIRSRLHAAPDVIRAPLGKLRVHLDTWGNGSGSQDYPEDPLALQRWWSNTVRHGHAIADKAHLSEQLHVQLACVC